MNQSPYQPSADDVVRCVASVESVPPSIVPPGSQYRTDLMRLAAAGRVECYKAAGTDGPWNLWSDDLAAIAPGRNGRRALDDPETPGIVAQLLEIFVDYVPPWTGGGAA